MTQLLPAPDLLETPSTAADHSLRKRHGVHYTPPGLARFLARRVLAKADRRRLTVLDPACGDGELLLAFASQAQEARWPAPHLVGIDRDQTAVDTAAARLSSAPAASIAVRAADFLLADESASYPARCDVIVSNPPYVRTQVLGAERAQALGRQFGLSGRVDLYHAFLAAMTARLTHGGILGIICSNRFMATKGGLALRDLLIKSYDISELWDMGDTRLFEAAVLPAVVVASRMDIPSGRAAKFVRVYRDDAQAVRPRATKSLLDALEGDVDGAVRVQGLDYTISRGELVAPEPTRPWRVTSPTGARWLAAVNRRAAGRFGDLGRIRVGIKTTADSVFIRASWDELAKDLRPEAELIHPLLTHRVAARWRAVEDSSAYRSVLYPHEIRDGRRRPVDLARFPRAEAYLEQHRERLQGRRYIAEAKRAWYEIWVPHHPDGWGARKLVWPDISDRPRFFLDETGAIVNGDCYWLSCADCGEDDLMLAMAVANSSFALHHYDLCCGNRLYAGRRRFITQYLQDLPLPSADGAALRDVGNLVRELRKLGVQASSDQILLIERQLDRAILELFGVVKVPR